MVESNDKSTILDIEGGGDGRARAPPLEDRHILCSFLPPRQLLYGQFLNESEMDQETTEMAIQTPVLTKLDPFWGYFCISDHNLILITYGDMRP